MLSTGEREPELVQSVLGIRLVVPEAIIGFAPGGDLSATDIQRIADMDLIFGDVPWDVRCLEGEWREWIVEPPRDVDAAFIGFCRKWFDKRGRAD